ncbi:hypothetical protein LTR29_002887 [Friedmanniomyces endolithicus]|nr:hypothetical protein LTR29_002887 [Friedmanniomyces endolithicus]
MKLESLADDTTDEAVKDYGICARTIMYRVPDLPCPPSAVHVSRRLHLGGTPAPHNPTITLLTTAQHRFQPHSRQRDASSRQYIYMYTLIIPSHPPQRDWLVYCASLYSPSKHIPVIPPAAPKQKLHDPTLAAAPYHAMTAKPHPGTRIPPPAAETLPSTAEARALDATMPSLLSPRSSALQGTYPTAGLNKSQRWESGWNRTIAARARGQQARHLSCENRRADSPPLTLAPRLTPIPTLSRRVAELIDERWTDEGARWSHCRIGSMSLTDELALRSCKCASQPRVRTRDTDRAGRQKDDGTWSAPIAVLDWLWS